MIQTYNPFNPNVTYHDYLDKRFRYASLILSCLLIFAAHLFLSTCEPLESYLLSHYGIADTLSYCYSIGTPLAYPVILVPFSLVSPTKGYLVLNFICLIASSILFFRTTVPTYLYLIFFAGVAPFSTLTTQPDSAGLAILIISLILLVHPTRDKHPYAYLGILSLAFCIHAILSPFAIMLSLEYIALYTLNYKGDKAIILNKTFLRFALIFLVGLLVASSQVVSLQLNISVNDLLKIPLSWLLLPAIAGILSLSWNINTFKYLIPSAYCLLLAGYSSASDFSVLLTLIAFSPQLEGSNDDTAKNIYNGATLIVLVLFAHACIRRL